MHDNKTEQTCRRFKLRRGVFLNFPVKSPGSGTVIAIAEPNWVILSTSSSGVATLLLPLHQHVLSLRYVRVLFLVQNTVLK